MHTIRHKANTKSEGGKATNIFDLSNKLCSSETKPRIEIFKKRENSMHHWSSDDTYDVINSWKNASYT